MFVIRHHPGPPTGGSHKFAMSLRLMRRPGNSQPLTHPWRALPDPQAWGDLPSHLGQGSRALPDAACLSKLSARSTGAVVGEPLPRAAGVLSPGPCPQLQCRHLGDPLPGQLYRLLLIALQLAQSTFCAWATLPPLQMGKGAVKCPGINSTSNPTMTTATRLTTQLTSRFRLAT